MTMCDDVKEAKQWSDRNQAAKNKRENYRKPPKAAITDAIDAADYALQNFEYKGYEGRTCRIGDKTDVASYREDFHKYSAIVVENAIEHLRYSDQPRKIGDEALFNFFKGAHFLGEDAKIEDGLPEKFKNFEETVLAAAEKAFFQGVKKERAQSRGGRG